MPSFNFFKIISSQKANLANLLIQRGLSLTDTTVENENGIQYICDLYFNHNPPTHPIKWVKELQKKFKLTNCDTKTYSAVVVISYGTTVYAVTFGTSHFLVSRFADFDFGIDIAARMIVTYSAKNSREFGGVKTKSIETYASADNLAFDAGEAVYYIKGSPSDANKKAWGKMISCGQSVQLQDRTFTIRRLHSLCSQLDRALALPSPRSIPRSLAVKDVVDISRLCQKLAADMKNGHYMVLISQQQLSGVAFLFADQHEFVCSVNGQTIELDEKTMLADLDAIVTTHFNSDYQALLDANVEARIDGVCAYVKKFICFVDYVDAVDRYYLEDGKWYRFDTEYMKIIRDEVDRIVMVKSLDLPQFDHSAYGLWKGKQLPKARCYPEWYINAELAPQLGYENCDTVLQQFQGMKLEITDLYKGETVFIVKVGTPQKLNYAIDQAIGAIRVLERQEFEILIKGMKRKVRKVCLWLFLERSTPISRMSDLKSLIFLMKLANWRRTVLLSGLQPEICISYM